MLKLAAVALAAFALQAGKNPDLKYVQSAGISMQKVPKQEEWKFQEKGFWQGSEIVLAHVVDGLTIEVFMQQRGNSAGSVDLKGTADNLYNAISTSASFKGGKKNSVKRVKMPGRGADGATVYLLDMTVTDMQDKEVEIRSYVFIGKKNRAFYDVRVTNPKGVYTKYKKFVDYSLSTVRTWKIK